MNLQTLIKKYSEYREVFSVRLYKDKVEIITSPRMAERILEALRVYSMVEEALHEFGKEIKEMD